MTIHIPTAEAMQQKWRATASGLTAPALATAAILAACSGDQASRTSPRTFDPFELQGSTQQQFRVSHDCIDTGTGLTAVVVNEDVVGQTIDIGNCDVGAFFSEDGLVEDSTFTQNDPNPGPSLQYGVRVEGANVDVRGSTFHVTEDYQRQIIHVGYLDGATGVIDDNTMTGFKRVGILLNGDETSAIITNNVLDGVGPKSTGWAENGIQLSSGATGKVRRNVIQHHWWDLTNFCSSGIILSNANDAMLSHNSVVGNDCGMIIIGNDNNVFRNAIDVQHEDATMSGNVDGSAGFDGIFIEGDDNAIRANDINGHENAFYGLWVFFGASDNKLIRNTITGFSEAIVDDGDGTLIRPPTAG